MKYSLKDNTEKQTIEAYDQENNLIGDAVFLPSMSLYQSVGYKFYKETESAIGMFL